MTANALSTIAIITQIVASISVIVGIIIALIQLREMAKARYLEALSKIFEEFRSEEFFAGRRFVYSHDRFDYNSCTSEERNKIERLINTYNRISFFVFKGMVSKNLILEMYSGAFVASWEKLENYIYVRRLATGFSDWAANFEKMAKISKVFRKKTLKEVGVDYKVPETPMPPAINKQSVTSSINITPKNKSKRSSTHHRRTK